MKPIRELQAMRLKFGRPSPPWHSRWSRSTMDRSSLSFLFRYIVLVFKEYIIDAMPLLCQKRNLNKKNSEPENVGFADFGISMCFFLLCVFILTHSQALTPLLPLSLTIPKRDKNASCTFKQKR